VLGLANWCVWVWAAGNSIRFWNKKDSLYGFRLQWGSMDTLCITL